MIRALSVVAILFACVAVAQQPNCPNGQCQLRPAAVSRFVTPPRVIYRPSMQWQAYEYQRTTIEPRYTPVRDWLFGRGRVRHWYGVQQ